MSEISYLQGNQIAAQKTGIYVERLRVAGYCRVSTDSIEQKNSYESQIQYYTDYIHQKSEWVFTGIYADEAATGTISKNRDEFMRMINDCMSGKLDLIVTKSISRFARNTLDTLKYVRMLKDKGVGVFFENENINTLTMDGELLLVILSAVAQQEVENTSANVKRGLKAKMQRGEYVGYPKCYGYDYDSQTKKLTVNAKEAEIVRYIFKRYLEGYGTFRIAKELTNLGIKTRTGRTQWHDSAIKTIIKNEKYVGDMLLGKTVTLDSIEKKRIRNDGQYDRYYVKEHHDAIINREDFEAVQKLYSERSNKSGLTVQERRRRYIKTYPFSNIIFCGMCGGLVTRKTIQSSTKYEKICWNCKTASKQGKKYCPYSHYHSEELIENAFVDAYKMICSYKTDAIMELTKRLEQVASSEDYSLQKKRLKKQIMELKEKRQTVYDLRIEKQIAHENFLKKYNSMGSEIEKLSNELQILEDRETANSGMKFRMNNLRSALEHENILDEFDEKVFRSLISKIIIGRRNEDETFDPHKITFYFKTGISMDMKSGKEQLEEVKKQLRIPVRLENNEECEILQFKHFCRFYDFTNDGSGGKKKNLISAIDISVCFDFD
ncbi:MAG: recombinase family protein [Eubacterium sp.]